VINELRVSGWPRRIRRWMRGHGRAAASDAVAEPEVDLDDLAPCERPRLLLERIMRLLVQHGQLPPPRALTARELSLAARLPQAEDRRRLENLARLTERLRFSDEEVSADSLAGVVAEGGLLLSQLSIHGRIHGEARA